MQQILISFRNFSENTQFMDSLSESVEQLYPRDIVQYLEIIAFSRNNNEKSEC